MFWHLLRNIFPPYKQQQEAKEQRRSNEGNSCLPVKARTVTYETFELYHPTLSCHSEKEDKAKNLQNFPETLEQAIKQSQHEIALSDAIFVFKIFGSACSKRV